MSCRKMWRPVASMLLDRLRHNVPMRNYTTMGVGGSAMAMAQPETAQELAAVLKVCRDNRLAYYIMGAGSNLLFLDEGFDGVVIKLGQAFKAIEFPGGNILRAGAAAQLFSVLEAAIGHELAGLEFLAGIPGTVGGAAWMNAGSFGRSVGQAITALKLATPEGSVITMPGGELTFGYRRLAGLPEGGVIIETDFLLEPGQAEAIRAAVKNNLNIRAERHPQGVRSAGSIFKNPSGQLPAGRIIEDCGLKGLKLGGAQISEKHANFIINPAGEASAGDVLGLVKKTIDEVRKQRGLTLEPEIKIIGARGEVGGYESI